jgi:dTDP-4-dehydrorhamnose 3,5-epimerase
VIFEETPIEGVCVIDLEPAYDNRGFFARTWCRREFEERGLCVDFAQSGIAFNHRCGTVRGLHLQRPPHEEIKLVRCTAGAIYDVLVDLRPYSSTFGHHFYVELSSANHKMVYVPEGVAHGYQTLTDGAEASYWISAYYAAQAATGVRWNDPALNIIWPLETTVVSERDRNLPLLEDYVRIFATSV